MDLVEGPLRGGRVGAARGDRADGDHRRCLIPWSLVAAAIAVVVIAAFLVTGDSVPAVLYLPTILIGIALLAGWT